MFWGEGEGISLHTVHTILHAYIFFYNSKKRPKPNFIGAVKIIFSFASSIQTATCTACSILYFVCPLQTELFFFGLCV
jgi:hypothetical protein